MKELVKEQARYIIDHIGILMSPLISPERTVAICGTPRGGTTWLEGLLSDIPKTKQYFEPLHPHRVA